MDIEAIATDIEAVRKTHNPRNYHEQWGYNQAIELLRSENPQTREELSDLIDLFKVKQKECGPCRLALQSGWYGAREVLQNWLVGVPA